MLAPNSTIIAIDRSEKKLDLAKKIGAEHIISLGEATRKEVMELTDGGGVDVIIDCVGAENTISTSVNLLAKSGVLAIVGLFGTKVRLPLMPMVLNEFEVTGSLWGNYNELREVLELARQGRIKHTIQTFDLEDINGAIDLLKRGQVTGRAVIAPDP